MTALLLKSPKILALLSRYTIEDLTRLFKVLTVLKRTSMAGSALLVLLVAVQLAYPSNRALPLQRLANGQSIGFKNKAGLQQTFQNLSTQPVTIQLNGTTYKQDLPTLGVHVDAKASADQFTKYSVSERLKPFSLFTKRTDATFVRSVEEQKLQQFAQQVAADNSISAKSASVVEGPNGTYGISKAVPGVRYDAQQVADTIQVLSPDLSQTVKVGGDAVQPAVTDTMIEEKIQSLNALKARTLKLDSGLEVSGTTLAAWANVLVDDAQGTVAIVYDKEAVKTWLNVQPAKGAVTAQPTTITYVDRVEVSRTAGVAGKAIDLDKTATAVIDAIEKKKASAQVSYTVTAIPVNKVQKYSNQSKGIQLLIEDWQARHKGMRAAVVFQEIGGQERHAETNANKQFFAASIYKLFVAKFVYDALSGGKISGSEKIINGKDTVGCLEAMIVVSDNACPEALANRFGWNNISDATKNAGFGNTSLKNGNNKVTAGDTAKYMRELYSGTLLDSSQSSSLLGYMSRQIYRKAIPAGASGATVYDKVGFYGKAWHDAAIVDNGSTKYVLVVLTENANPSAIAEITKQINQTIK